MNMILHGNETAEIAQGRHASPARSSPSGDAAEDLRLRRHEPAVLNQGLDNGLENDYGRFEYGMPPEKNGDYAFLLHVLKSLKSTGKAAVILPHGVLFRGNAEATSAAAAQARLHQGHHRPAGEPLLRHRHPGLHRRPRQGERRRPAPASS